MFGPARDKNRNDTTETVTEDTSSTLAARAEQSLSLPRAAGAPSTTRRMPDVSRRAATNGDAGRKLIVGEGLSLSGEITSCDILVVAGKVEAKLTDGKLLEINETGQFRGSVEIENADIAGRYDGQLVVHGRLTLRSTGRISGSVKYGELEVNAGGQIIGELQVSGAQQQNASGPGGFKSATKFTSLIDEEPDNSDDRKSA